MATHERHTDAKERVESFQATGSQTVPETFRSQEIYPQKLAKGMFLIALLCALGTGGSVIAGKNQSPRLPVETAHADCTKRTDPERVPCDVVAEIERYLNPDEEGINDGKLRILIGARKDNDNSVFSAKEALTLPLSQEDRGKLKNIIEAVKTLESETYLNIFGSIVHTRFQKYDDRHFHEMREDYWTSFNAAKSSRITNRYITFTREIQAKNYLAISKTYIFDLENKDVDKLLNGLPVAYGSSYGQLNLSFPEVMRFLEEMEHITPGYTRKQILEYLIERPLKKRT